MHARQEHAPYCVKNSNSSGRIAGKVYLGRAGLQAGHRGLQAGRTEGCRLGAQGCRLGTGGCRLDASPARCTSANGPRRAHTPENTPAAAAPERLRLRLRRPRLSRLSRLRLRRSARRREPAARALPAFLRALGLALDLSLYSAPRSAPHSAEQAYGIMRSGGSSDAHTMPIARVCTRHAMHTPRRCPRCASS